jgi:hypothetical protein
MYDERRIGGHIKHILEGVLQGTLSGYRGEINGSAASQQIESLLTQSTGWNIRFHQQYRIVALVGQVEIASIEAA